MSDIDKISEIISSLNKYIEGIRLRRDSTVWGRARGTAAPGAHATLAEGADAGSCR